MDAAVVTRFDQPPQFGQIDVPEPRFEHDLVVDVLAAGLHQRVRSQAAGSHYTSTDHLPLVPGIDGVGRDSEGRLRYFLLPTTTMGSMAQQTVIDARRSVILPEDTDPVALAAAMNPAMSSWVALRQRISFEPGQDVLILGATGNSGQMAVRIAKLFGAGKIIAAGRDTAKLAHLPSLGATDTIRLGADDTVDRLAELAADVDVVIDYVWGETTVAAMTAIVPRRSDPGHQLTWIEIGSVGGPTANIPSAAFRAARLQLVGSGQGSITPSDYMAQLPALATEIVSGALRVDASAVPLRDVTAAWTADETNGRIVLVP